MLNKIFLLLLAVWGRNSLKKTRQPNTKVSKKIFKLDLFNFQLGFSKQVDFLPSVKVKSRIDQARQFGLNALSTTLGTLNKFKTESVYNYPTILKDSLTDTVTSIKNLKDNISDIYKKKEPVAKIRYAINFGYTPFIIRLDKYAKLNLGVGGHYVFSYQNLDYEAIKSFNLDKILGLGELAFGPSIQLKLLNRFRLGCNLNLKQVIRRPTENYDFINQDFKLSSMGLDVFLGFRVFYGLEAMVGFNTSNSNLKSIFRNGDYNDDNNVSLYFGLNYLN